MEILEFEEWHKSCNSKCDRRVGFKQSANGAYVAIDGPGKDNRSQR